MVGGEPLLLPENERLLDVIPQDAIITLITNMSVDLEKNKIFRKLSQRRRVGWSMSFDNIEDKFEYVRHGGNWSLLKNNLNIIKNLMLSQGHWGGIHAVYNIYSATKVCELRQFAEETGVSVLWQNLFQPDYLDSFLHGPRVAKLAADEIQKFYALGIATDTERIFFNEAMKKYNSVQIAQPGIEQKFTRHIQKIETEYHPDKTGMFKQLWPELAGLINDQ